MATILEIDSISQSSTVAHFLQGPDDSILILIVGLPIDKVIHYNEIDIL